MGSTLSFAATLGYVIICLYVLAVLTGMTPPVAQVIAGVLLVTFSYLLRD